MVSRGVAIGMVLAGALMAVAPALEYGRTRRMHEEDLLGIERLRSAIDSAEAALARSVTAADSAPLEHEIGRRRYYLGRLEFHVPLRAERLARWWRPLGPAMVVTGLGIAMLVVGLARLRTRAGGDGRPT